MKIYDVQASKCEKKQLKKARKYIYIQPTSSNTQR